MAAIERSKQNDLSRVIFALGIPEVGEKTAALLAVQFGSMEQLAQATGEQLMQMDGFGEVGPDKMWSASLRRSATAARFPACSRQGSTWKARKPKQAAVWRD